MRNPGSDSANRQHKNSSVVCHEPSQLHGCSTLAAHHWWLKMPRPAGCRPSVSAPMLIERVPWMLTQPRRAPLLSSFFHQFNDRKRHTGLIRAKSTTGVRLCVQPSTTPAGSLPCGHLQPLPTLRCDISVGEAWGQPLKHAKLSAASLAPRLPAFSKRPIGTFGLPCSRPRSVEFGACACSPHAG